MKKVLKHLAIGVLLIGILCSCKGNSASKYELPKLSNDNELILYDRMKMKLVAYNAESLTETYNDEANYYQYSFSPLSNIYTTGHSIDGHFKIISCDNAKSFRTIYEAKDNEAVFPLASIDEKKGFFVFSNYKEDGSEEYDKRYIAKVDYSSGKKQKLNKTEGLLISEGAYDIENHILYFTSYNEDMDDYTLYKLNYSDENSELDVCEQNLKSSNVYFDNGYLYLTDSNNVFCKENSFSYAKGDNDFINNGYLFTIHLGDGDVPVLDVVDISNKQVIKTISGIIDYKHDSGRIAAYTFDGIENIDIN